MKSKPQLFISFFPLHCLVDRRWACQAKIKRSAHYILGFFLTLPLLIYSKKFFIFFIFIFKIGYHFHIKNIKLLHLLYLTCDLNLLLKSYLLLGAIYPQFIKGNVFWFFLQLVMVFISKTLYFFISFIQRVISISFISELNHIYH